MRVLDDRHIHALLEKGRLCNALAALEEGLNDRGDPRARLLAYSYCLMQLGQYRALRHLLEVARLDPLIAWRVCISLASAEKLRSAKRALALARAAHGSPTWIGALEVYILGFNDDDPVRLASTFDLFRIEAAHKLVGVPLALHMYRHTMLPQAEFLVGALTQAYDADQEAWNFALFVAGATSSRGRFSELSLAAAHKYPDNPVIERHGLLPHEASEVRLASGAERALLRIHEINPLDYWVSQALSRNAMIRGDIAEAARVTAKMTFWEDRFCGKRFVRELSRQGSNERQWAR